MTRSGVRFPSAPPVVARVCSYSGHLTGARHRIGLNEIRNDPAFGGPPVDTVVCRACRLPARGVRTGGFRIEASPGCSCLAKTPQREGLTFSDLFQTIEPARCAAVTGIHVDMQKIRSRVGSLGPQASDPFCGLPIGHLTVRKGCLGKKGRVRPF